MGNDRNAPSQHRRGANRLHRAIYAQAAARARARIQDFDSALALRSMRDDPEPDSMWPSNCTTLGKIMVSEDVSRITVRDTAEADVPALTAIKGNGSESLHRDRLRDAQGIGFRYLVLLADQELIAFACLVIRRPAYWSDADDTRHLPQIVDLRVKASRREQGYGSKLVRAIERIAAQAGYRQLY